MSTPGPRPRLVPLNAEQQRVVAENVGLVHLMVRQMKPHQVSVDGDDLASAGYEALIRAAKAFDPGRGVKFSTYACRAIFSQMRNEVWRLRIRAPYQQMTKKVERNIADKHPGQQEAHDSAELCGIAMAALNDRERLTLNMLVVDGAKLREVSPFLGGLCIERVRQISNEAKGKARLAAERAMGELAKGAAA